MIDFSLVRNLTAKARVKTAHWKRKQEFVISQKNQTKEKQRTKNLQGQRCLRFLQQISSLESPRSAIFHYVSV